MASTSATTAIASTAGSYQDGEASAARKDAQSSVTTKMQHENMVTSVRLRVLRPDGPGVRRGGLVLQSENEPSRDVAVGTLRGRIPHRKRHELVTTALDRVSD